MKRGKYFLPTAGLLTLLFTLGLSLQLLGRKQEVREKAAESTQSASPTKPDYLSGEVLVKFTSDVEINVSAKDQGPFSIDLLFNDPQSFTLAKFLKEEGITKLEKVIKEAEEPEKELTKLKSRFPNRRIDEEAIVKTDLSRIYKLSFAQEINPYQMASKLFHSHYTQYAEPNYVIELFQPTPNDSFFDKQWALNNLNTDDLGQPIDADIDATEAWEIEQGSEDVILAVVDTGVDYTHPDLGGCLGPQCKVVGGYNFLNDNPDPIDTDGHGTHVAGIMAAQADNSLGVSGVCPNCRLLVFNASDLSVNAIPAIYQATLLGARVINNSWGLVNYSHALYDIFLWSTQAGVTSVAAAGNGNNESRSDPAGYENVLAVAASNNVDKKASYSQYGDWIDLTAPGGDYDPNPSCSSCQSDCCQHPPDLAIYSTISEGDVWDCISQNSACEASIESGGRYLSYYGTSMASPHVAGAAGLVLSRYPELNPEEVQILLKESADDIYPINPDYLNKLGVGRLNLHRALTITPKRSIVYSSHHLDDSQLISPDNKPNGVIEPGETVQLEVFIKAAWGDFNNLNTVLSSSEPEIRITPTQSSSNNLSRGETKNATFNLEIGAQAVVNQRIPFSLLVTADQNYQKTIDFSVVQPPSSIVLDSHRVIDSETINSANNSNGLVNPGETIELEVVIKNT